MTKLIGILGGSFNPVHNGHLMLASYIAQYGPVDSVWLMLSPCNPFKVGNEMAPDEQRYAMLQLACDGSGVVSCCDMELGMPRPSYTISTLRELKATFPGYRFKLIIGSDNLINFPKWRESESILEEFGLIVYPRPGYSTDSVVDDRITVVEAPVVGISSTFIREGLSQGKDMNFFLPREVYDYILNNNLYRKKECKIN